MILADQPPNIQLPADPSYREGLRRQAGLGWPRRDAIIVAALVHAAVIAALLIQWPNSLAPAPVPPPIPVTLVTEPPPPPPPVQPPAPKPPPQAMHELESGPDQVTTAPPQAAAKGPEAAPKPQPEDDIKDEKAAVAEPPKTKPSPAVPPRAAQPKEATRETVPKPELGSIDRAPGDIDRTGDPYLNRLWALIESHRTYPANAIGSLGLQLEGTVTYLIEISPTGALLGIRLARSAGAEALDDTARKMIEESAPFPPLPGNFPHDGVVLSVSIHLFPGTG